MNWLEAILLGLVQGLTEFLPVSSSGHLEIGKFLFGINAEENFYFTVALHGATVLSTIVVFRRDIAILFKRSFIQRRDKERFYTRKLFISMIPVAVTGLLYRENVKNLFSGDMHFIGLMLLVTALLLALGHFLKNRERHIGYLDALIIGIAQAVAVIPGISRSGATISTGLILGNRKDELAKFSFLMVIIPIIGAFIVDFSSADKQIGDTSVLIMLTGAAAAFVSGYLACKWMIALVRKSKMIWFSIYCAAIGVLTLFLA